MSISEKHAATRWLITGINGLIGQTLVKLLDAEPTYVAGVGRGKQRINSSQMNYYMVGRPEFNTVQNVVSEVCPDVIVHLAAMTDVDECELNKHTAMTSNVFYTSLWLDACAKLAPKAHFIYLSTDFIFEGKDIQYKEEDARMPINYYGKTKMFAEDCVSGSTLLSAIIRTSLVYGPPLQSQRKDIIRWVAQQLHYGKGIRLVTDQYRRPTYTIDIAHAIIAIAQQRLAGVYHITGNEQYTPYEIGIKVANHLRIGDAHSRIMPVSSLELKQAARRPARTVLAIDKATRTMHYTPSSFDVSLIATLQNA